MKKQTYNKRKKRVKKEDTFDDLIYHDVLEEHDSRDDTDVELEINDEDDIDLVEDALDVVDIIEELPEVVEAPVVDPNAPKRKGKPADKTKFYVDPKEFDDEIIRYYDSGKMSDNLANMISKISHKLSYAPNFINYTYREEMVGDGVIRMMKALMAKKYNRDKGTNPFSYFTRIAFNAFRNRIKKEKHMVETHEKYQNELMLMSQNYNVLVKNNNIRINKERERY
jgi:DNA-directed RNA polymerase specialized sigma24 family protein